jgi:hypothetical protein
MVAFLVEDATQCMMYQSTNSMMGRGFQHTWEKEGYTPKSTECGQACSGQFPTWPGFRQEHLRISADASIPTADLMIVLSR